MKVCLINSIYKPYTRGGAEVVFDNIVTELKNRGHDIFIITIGRKTEVEDIDGVKIYRINPFNIFSFLDINKKPPFQRLIWLLFDIFNVDSFSKVRKILKHEKPVLVLSHNLKGLGYLTLKAVKALKIINFHTLHDIQLANPSGLMYKGEEDYWLNSSILSKIYRKINRNLFNSPQIVISPSQWLLDYYTQRGFFNNSKKSLLPNPVIPSKEIEKNENGDLTYLFLGQIESHKGIKLLLEAWSSFKKGKLLIGGEGTLLDELKEEYKDDETVEFLGYVKHEKLNELFKKINYTVIPSLCYENSPTVIYDSFMNQTPVIAADIGGVSELVKDGFNGYIFEAGDKTALLNKLNTSFEHSENSSKLGQNGKIMVSDYTIDKYIDRIFNLYKKEAK